MPDDDLSSTLDLAPEIWNRTSGTRITVPESCNPSSMLNLAIQARCAACFGSEHLAIQNKLRDRLKEAYSYQCQVLAG